MFFATKQGIDDLQGVMYKLRIMGVPYVFIKTSLYNTSRSESGLNKMSNSVCDYEVHGLAAMSESLGGHKSIGEKFSDLMTTVT